MKCLNEIQGKMSADRYATTPRRHVTGRCPDVVGNWIFSPLSLAEREPMRGEKKGIDWLRERSLSANHFGFQNCLFEDSSFFDS
jgi:hypothetical protein